MIIRPAIREDALWICEIYNPFVLGSTITFEETPVGLEEMARRIGAADSDHPWLVAEEDSGVIGYAYASKWKARSAYRFSVETTVYVKPEVSRKGVGAALYMALIDMLKKAGVHSAIGGIALPNVASVAMHERLGFQKAAEFREVGFKHGKWINVGYWELLL